MFYNGPCSFNFDKQHSVEPDQANNLFFCRQARDKLILSPCNGRIDVVVVKKCNPTRLRRTTTYMLLPRYRGRIQRGQELRQHQTFSTKFSTGSGPTAMQVFGTSAFVNK